MRIRDGLFMVASGHAGFDLTHPLDCNVYLMATSAGHILFDSGAGVDVDVLLAEMKRDGIDPETITRLFLTHGHADHSGGAELLRAYLPNLTVAAGPKTATMLAANDERLISLDRARGQFYPDDYRWTAPAVGQVLTPDEPLTIGDLRLTLIETPGHSDDHVSFLLQRSGWTALVSGDAIFAGGKVILQDTHNSRVSETIATIRRLATIDFDVFLPGHSVFSLADGRRHVDEALHFADMGLPPPQLF